MLLSWLYVAQQRRLNEHSGLGLLVQKRGMGRFAADQAEDMKLQSPTKKLRHQIAQVSRTTDHCKRSVKQQGGFVLSGSRCTGFEAQAWVHSDLSYSLSEITHVAVSCSLCPTANWLSLSICPAADKRHKGDTRRGN